LKELLRTAAVPPWERERLPLLYSIPTAGLPTALLAVGDLFVDTRIQVHLEAPPTRGRFRLEWDGRFW
jgi:hypothetical protein